MRSSLSWCCNGGEGGLDNTLQKHNFRTIVLVREEQIKYILKIFSMAHMGRTLVLLHSVKPMLYHNVCQISL